MGVKQPPNWTLRSDLPLRSLGTVGTGTEDGGVVEGERGVFLGGGYSGGLVEVVEEGAVLFFGEVALELGWGGSWFGLRFLLRVSEVVWNCDEQLRDFLVFQQNTHRSRG